MPRPEPRVLAALLQGRRSRHLCSWGGRDAAGAPGSLSQTQSLSPKGREVDKEREAVAPGRSTADLCFPGVLWTVCGWGWEGEGGRGRGAFRSLEPEFLLSGPVCFSKAHLKQFYKRSLPNRF